jgi:hypothetical protein
MFYETNKGLTSATNMECVAAVTTLEIIQYPVVDHLANFGTSYRARGATK